MNEIFEELRKDISSYIDTKTKILKLDVYEKTSKIISLLSYGLIFLFLALFAFLFLFLTFGFYLSSLLESYAAGFALIAAMYMLVILIIWIYRKRIQFFVFDKILTSLLKENTTNDEA